jgi:hypothetical protein
MRIAVGTPFAWYLKTEIHTWRNRFISEQLAAVAKVMVIEAEGSIIDRNWSNVIRGARQWKPDWFVLIEADVTIPGHGQELAKYLEKAPYDAIMSPGGGVTGPMWRFRHPDSKPGNRILQDYSFWQNVRSTGAKIIADPALRSEHHHTYGTYHSETEMQPVEVHEGWMGLAAIRGWVLADLKKLFTIADCDYYCAQNDVRVDI